MKKFLSIFISISVIIMCFALTAGAAAKEETTNLIASDGTYEKTLSHANAVIEYTFDDNGVMKVNSTVAGTWPNLMRKFDSYKVDPNKTWIELDFELVSGSTSIRLSSIEKVGSDPLSYENICLHHFVEGFDESMIDTGSGDLQTAGSYKLKVKLADLKLTSGTAADKFLANKDLITDDDGLFDITNITIYAANVAEIKINKFNVIVETEVVDESSSESSTPASESSSTTPTGDAGYIALAVIAVVALAGAVVLKKTRK